jgi:3',5'-cyclic AMP phosphodiesterase CpdA
MILQLSDLHVGAPTGDPEGDLARVVAHVGTLGLRPEAVLVSGDLTEHGEPAEYARVRELLEPLAAPVVALPGNHDRTPALRAAFPETAHDGAIRVLTLDSSIPGRDDGALGAGQLEALDATLAAAPATPTLVALHHPPLATGMPFLDDIGLDPGDRAALAAIAGRHPQLVRIACGHVHMVTTGLLGTTPVLTVPSTWRIRARLRLGAPGWEPEEAPAGFALHLPLDGTVTSHVVTF